MIVAGLILIAGAIVAYFIRDDRRQLASFKALAGTAARQARYRRWIVKGFAIFAGTTVLGLLMIGRIEAVVHFPPEFLPLAARLPRYSLDRDGLFFGMMAGAMLAGGVIGGLLTRLRKGRKPIMLGDIAAILPRNRAELGWGAVLAVNAGVTEELFFRLLLPLLLVLATGNVLFAFAAATLIFGLVHFYQGWVGVIATTLVGALLCFLYLASGSLLVAISVHILIDLNGLVLRPMMAGAWRTGSAA